MLSSFAKCIDSVPRFPRSHNASRLRPAANHHSAWPGAS
jgi:hypothetical protein